MPDLLLLQIFLRDQFSQANDAGGVDHELLFLLGKIESFDVNEIAVRCGNLLQGLAGEAASTTSPTISWPRILGKPLVSSIPATIWV